MKVPDRLTTFRVQLHGGEMQPPGDAGRGPGSEEQPSLMTDEESSPASSGELEGLGKDRTIGDAGGSNDASSGRMFHSTHGQPTPHAGVSDC